MAVYLGREKVGVAIKVGGLALENGYKMICTETVYFDSDGSVFIGSMLSRDDVHYIIGISSSMEYVSFWDADNEQCGYINSSGDIVFNADNFSNDGPDDTWWYFDPYIYTIYEGEPFYLIGLGY